MIPVGFELRAKVLEYEEALKNRTPRMGTLLQEILANLKAQPENVTLITEEEIGKIVQGLEIQTNTFLAETVTAKKVRATDNIKALIKAKGEDAF